MSVKVEKVVVLGAGSAGLVAALTLKLKIPSLHVRVIASSQIGVIGVGAGSVPWRKDSFMVTSASMNTSFS